VVGGGKKKVSGPSPGGKTSRSPTAITKTKEGCSTQLEWLRKEGYVVREKRREGGRGRKEAGPEGRTQRKGKKRPVELTKAPDGEPTSVPNKVGGAQKAGN